MKIIDNGLLDEVSRQAAESPRLRMNYNFHDTLEANAQRLLNALEPGTELPVHRHCFTAETYIVLRGEINVFFYDDDKRVTESVTLNPLKGEYGINFRFMILDFSRTSVRFGRVTDSFSSKF